jgi:hypothetical protein
MKKKLYLALIILFLFLAGGLSYFLFGSISKGVRVGTVAKLEKRGAFWETNEGELFTGGQSGHEGGDLSSSTWSFSVARGDEEILEKIRQSMADEKRVELYYREKFYSFGMMGNTRFFITEVKLIESAKAQP